MKTEHIDYLAYSIDYKYAPIGGKEITGIRNYKQGFKCDDGTITFIGNALTERAYVVLSGEALANLYNEGVSMSEYIDYLISNGGKVSRLDLAVDMFIGDDLITPDELIYWINSNKVSTALLKGGARFIGDANGWQTETLYIGNIKKRAKKGIFRAYDKGVDIGIGKDLITRFELELRRDKAHTNAKRLLDGLTPSQIMGSYIQIDDDRWLDLISSPVDLSRGKANKDTESDELENRWLWLFDKVAPALGRAMAEDYNRGLPDDRLQAFIAIAMAEFKLNSD